MVCIIRVISHREGDVPNIFDIIELTLPKVIVGEKALPRRSLVPWRTVKYTQPWNFHGHWWSELDTIPHGTSCMQIQRRWTIEHLLGRVGKCDVRALCEFSHPVDVHVDAGRFDALSDDFVPVAIPLCRMRGPGSGGLEPVTALKRGCDGYILNVIPRPHW